MSHKQNINVVWHVAAMGDWRQVVEEQLALAGRVGLTLMRTTFVGEGIDYLLEAARRHGVGLFVVRQDANVRHYETFAMLEVEALGRASDKPILYWHTKGVSAPWDEGKRRWRRVMQRVVVERWRENVDHLQRFNAVGFNWRNCVGCPHFSGNFWVARAEHIRRLPDFVGYHAARGFVRFNCEFWPGAVDNPCIASLGTTDEDCGQAGYDWTGLFRRVEVADRRLKLNLGCNRWYHDGWLNVDNDPANRADLRDDAEALPSVEVGSVHEIYAGHLVEHLEHLGQALRRWYSLLTPGGVCTICVPDLVGSIALWRAGKWFPGVELPADQGLLAVTTGVPTLDWIASDGISLHRRLFDADSLRLCMEACGFQRIVQVDDHPLMVRRCSDLGWQIALEGVKGR
jgi:hypothetical protein